MLFRLVLALLAASSAQAAAIERFESFVGTTQSARADFEQKVFDRDRKLVQEAKGSFVLLRPGRFRWVYDKPVDQLIVGDGERVWIYDRELKQATVRKLSKALGSTPAALLAGASDVESAFELSDAGERDGLEWLEAKPRDREAGFERIRMGLGSGGIESMELADNFGQRCLLRFCYLVRHPDSDTAPLRLRPPEGVDVLGDQ